MIAMVAMSGTAAAATFAIVDEMLGTGPDALKMKVLRNLQSGESFGVVYESGGKTEFLRLRSKRTGKLRDVLHTHDNNATAVRLALMRIRRQLKSCLEKGGQHA